MFTARNKEIIANTAVLASGLAGWWFWPTKPSEIHLDQVKTTGVELDDSEHEFAHMLLTLKIIFVFFVVVQGIDSVHPRRRRWGE